MPTRIIVHSIYRVCTPIWVIRRISSAAAGRDAASWLLARVCGRGRTAFKDRLLYYIIIRMGVG